MRTNLKKLLPLLLIIVLTSSCTSSTINKSNKDTLTIAITKDENTLTPFTYVRGAPGIEVMRLMYDSLFTISEQNDVIPWMVNDDFVISDDFKTYEMTLKDGQKWHDGTPLTVDDVMFTFTYLAVDATHPRWTPIALKVRSMSTSDNIIKFTLFKPDPGFLRSGLADMPIIQKAAYLGNKEPKNVANMGSGAYKLAEYKSSQFYTLVAMNDYFRGKPKVETIQMPIITDQTVIQQALISGDIATFTGSINPEVFETLSDSNNITVEKSNGFASTLLLFNNETPPFSNSDFRNAISCAIDTNLLVEKVKLGYAKVGTESYVRDNLPEFTEDLPHVFDVEKSNEILEHLGYIKGDDGKRLTLDGKPFTLELLVQSSNTENLRIAEIIEMQLAEVGLDVIVSPLDADVLDSYVWPDFDTSKSGSFQMAMWGWSAPVVQETGAIAAACSSDYANVGLYNISHFKNELFDKLARQFINSANAEERAKLNVQMQQIVAQQTPFVTIYYPDNLSAVNTEMYDGWVFASGTNAVNIHSFVK